MKNKVINSYYDYWFAAQGEVGDQTYRNLMLDTYKDILDWLQTTLEKNETMQEEINRLLVMLHDEMSQLEIATDLGQKRWMALNEIVEHANQKSADWCRRKAKEGLGLK